MKGTTVVVEDHFRPLGKGALMNDRYPESTEVFLQDHDACRLAAEDPKRWRAYAWERVEREYGNRLRDLASSHDFWDGIDAEDRVQVFYEREFSGKRTILMLWEPFRASLWCFLKTCFLNFMRSERRGERRARVLFRPLSTELEQWIASDPETSDPARILFPRCDADRRNAASEGVPAAIAAFRAHCEARGLGHYWTVLDRHDLRPQEFGDPSQDETAAVLGRTRRDVTNWLARARKLLRRFAERAGCAE